MRLSICIPVYNFNINNLVSDIHQQILSNDLDAEIILIDDDSDEDFKIVNKQANQFVSSFIELDTNVGRSKIRNKFLEFSTGQYLLFLDCDGKILSNNFLNKYCDYIKTHTPDVVYGGRIVDAKKPNKDYLLRWRFAIERENISLEEKIKHPYTSFQTNNFVIDRTVFEKILFNETITGYGYEDLIFSFDLHSQNFKIDFIENPIQNIDIETNRVFVKKAAESAFSLSQIIKSNYKSDYFSKIKLVYAYKLLEKYKLISLTRCFFNIIEYPLKKILEKGNVSLRFLDFFKLGKLIQFMSVK